ncbi:MAG: hypothetical protein IKG46_10015 [Solobacterium sp.]|nr:hypothetical protein [Solobacterium sp.]
MYENHKNEIYQITAGEVTVEVTDRTTGRTFRRTFPIDYLETSSVVRLRGEDLQGNPSEIVFFTSYGKKKLEDLTGQGIDYDPCGSHTH